MSFCHREGIAHPAQNEYDEPNDYAIPAESNKTVLCKETYEEFYGGYRIDKRNQASKDEQKKIVALHQDVSIAMLHQLIGFEASCAKHCRHSQEKRELGGSFLVSF